MARAYLDHASTSPLRPEALTAMVDVLQRSAAGEIGDPGRIHAEGMAARALLEEARDRIAAWLDVRPRQVVLTSGATESIAAATWGARALGRGEHGTTHVVASPVEHSAVRSWTARGPHTEVGVDAHGRVQAEEVANAVRPDTAIVHVQWSNHEVATRQPVEEVVELLADHHALVHVDAAQAGPDAPAAVASGADLVSLSGHKAGAPAGIGLMVVRRGRRIPPLLVGGDQERARRAGMEQVAAAAGLAAVADQLASDGAAETTRLAELAARIRSWAAGEEGVHVLGDPEHHAPHLVCLGLDGVEPQPVLLGLDRRQVAVHSGSSCSSEAFEPSPVLAAMGADAHRSLRLSVGWSTTTQEVDAGLDALDEVLVELRRLRRVRT